MLMLMMPSAGGSRQYSGVCAVFVFFVAVVVCWGARTDQKKRCHAGLVIRASWRTEVFVCL